jgi:hypothetical protein
MSTASFLFSPSESLYKISRPLLVLIDKPWTELSETDVQQLKRILEFIRVNLGIQQVNFDSVTIRHMPLQSKENLRVDSTVLAFGHCIEDIQNYMAVQHGSFRVIQAETLDRLTDETKKTLAVALKQLFVND